MQKSTISWKFERRLLREGVHTIAGIDEAGRGPLAGPVVAAAVILPLVGERLPADCFGLDDSKKLSHAEREELFEFVRSKALAIGIGIRTNTDIDRLNILRATMEAMTDAVRQVESVIEPQLLLVDGHYFRTSLAYKYQTIVGGDGLSPSVASASIIAKVTRDRIMREFHEEYPHYNFLRNKGYGTAEHREAIAKYGYCPIHRRSFKLKDVQEKLFA